MTSCPSLSLSCSDTSFCHMRCISLGGPGMAINSFPCCSTHQPGAVPRGLGMGRAEGMRVACLMLLSGMGKPRLEKKSLSWRSSSASTASSSLSMAAMASRVRSSAVGPSPPVTRTRSERPQARSRHPLSRSRLSPTWVIQ